MRGWAEETQQRKRLGRAAPEELARWWDEMMAATNPDVRVAATTTAAGRIDVTERLAHIEAPTLIITTDDNALLSLEKMREYQGRIAHSRLLVLPGDSYHPAATMPARVRLAYAQVYRKFPSVIRRRSDADHHMKGINL
ncbi:MAG: alpha/beta fold hydrolase [Candidatus Binataceae bacterium]